MGHIRRLTIWSGDFRSFSALKSRSSKPVIGVPVSQNAQGHLHQGRKRLTVRGPDLDLVGLCRKDRRAVDQQPRSDGIGVRGPKQLSACGWRHLCHWGGERQKRLVAAPWQKHAWLVLLELQKTRS